MNKIIEVEINKEYYYGNDALKDLGYKEIGEEMINKINGCSLDQAIRGVSPKKDVCSIDNYIETTIYEKDGEKYGYVGMDHFNTFIYKIFLVKLSRF